jgi:uncharacterized membrane protein YgcG
MTDNAEYHAAVERFNLGLLLEARGDVTTAEAAYRQAAAARHAGAALNLGVLLEARGELAEAGCWYRQAHQDGEPNAAWNVAALVGPHFDDARQHGRRRSTRAPAVSLTAAALAGAAVIVVGATSLVARDRPAAATELAGGGHAFQRDLRATGAAPPIRVRVAQPNSHLQPRRKPSSHHGSRPSRPAGTPVLARAPTHPAAPSVPAVAPGPSRASSGGSSAGATTPPEQTSPPPATGHPVATAPAPSAPPAPSQPPPSPPPTPPSPTKGSGGGSHGGSKSGSSGSSPSGSSGSGTVSGGG